MERHDDTCTYVNILGNGGVAIDNKEIRRRKNSQFPDRDHYDREKALEQSRRILEMLNSPVASHRSLTRENEHHQHEDLRRINNQMNSGNINLASCYICKTLMPVNFDHQCKLCQENFCGRHRAEISHNCEKLSKETSKYLNAKNQFKLRLREAKSKAVR